MRIPNQTCCFCKQLVLGIGDQDTFLDPYNLLEEPFDLEVSKHGIVGYVHASCLSQSRWSDFWQERLFQNFIKVRGFKEIATQKSMIGFSDRLGEFVVVRPGTALRFGLAEYSDGHLEESEEEVVWDFRDYRSLAKLLEVTLRHDEVMELDPFLEKFNQSIGRQLYVPVDGTITPYTDEPEETFRCLKGSVFGGKLRCKVKLISEEATVVESFLRRDNNSLGV